MKKYLSDYLKELEKLLADLKDPEFDYEELMRSHLQMIQFMQHERLIHFLVTMLFAICFFIALGIFLIGNLIYMLPLLILILSLLVPYIAHYYFLENSVQKMSRLYDEINARRKAQTH